MLKSKLKKVFFIVASIMLTTTCAASSIRDYFVGGTTNSLNFGNMKNTIYGILTWTGYFLAICVILITGVQFLTANSQKKAQLKEKLWLIVLGVAVLAGGIPLLQLIANLIEDSSRLL